jgi:hypothetical protein
MTERSFDLATVHKLLDEAEAALVQDLPSLTRELSDTLALYRGIPAAIDVFEILGLHGDEDRHTAFFAWLLDPVGSHRLGDRFLRKFLSFARDPAIQRLIKTQDRLRAWVRPWLSLGNAGIPDLVLVVEGGRARSAVIVLEAKIYAALTLVDGKPQTTRYRMALSAPREVERLVLGPCRLSSTIRTEAPELVFLFLRTDTTQVAEPDLEEQHYRSIEYSQVERALALIVDDLDVAADTRALIQQFRTALLAEAVPHGQSLTALQQLRDLRDDHSIDAGYRRTQRLREALLPFRTE